MRKYLILAFILVSAGIRVNSAVTPTDTMQVEVNKDLYINHIECIMLDNNNNIIMSFKNGKRSGHTLFFDKRRTDTPLSILGLSFYDKGDLKGSSVDFYPNGVVKALTCNIQPNTDYPELSNWYPYQSYCYKFYDNGKIESEGLGLIGEEIELGDSIRMGIWKYYDVDGNLINEIEFPREVDGIDGRWLF